MSQSFENTDVDSHSRDEIHEFTFNTFLVIVDSVIDGICNRFKAINVINNKFSFLWRFTEIEEVNVRESAASFVNTQWMFQTDWETKSYISNISTKQILKVVFHLLPY